VDSAALRGELKSNSVAQVKDNVIRIDPSTKAGQHKRRFHSRVYVGTVHANLKFLPNRNWYPGAWQRCCNLVVWCIVSLLVLFF
jgi:hypothetical protein